MIFFSKQQSSYYEIELRNRNLDINNSYQLTKKGKKLNQRKPSKYSNKYRTNFYGLLKQNRSFSNNILHHASTGLSTQMYTIFA